MLETEWRNETFVGLMWIVESTAVDGQTSAIAAMEEAERKSTQLPAHP
ncbi:MAG: hypothetical protein OXH79_23705 [Boseongicola sp.]|nr:hypothetical protein [Boseongicola sp.]